MFLIKVNHLFFSQVGGEFVFTVKIFEGGGGGGVVVDDDDEDDNNNN